MKEIKRVSLIGMGAMGSFFAHRLSALLGTNFKVLASGERKARLERGVVINGDPCALTVVEPGEETAPADLVILAVKDYALPDALEQIAGQVGPNTILLPVLNGLDCAQRTGAVYGMERVLYASMWVAASMKDGVAEYDAAGGLIRFGETKNDVPTPRVQAVCALFDRAGIRYQVEPDMLRCLWVKFMGNVSENLTCALLGVPYGAFQIPQADAIRHALMEEVAVVAGAAGVTLTAEDMALRDRVAYGQAPSNRPSTLQDLERRKPTEVDLFAGTMVRLGEKYGVPTPLSWLMLQGIRVLETKNEGTIPGM